MIERVQTLDIVQQSQNDIGINLIEDRVINSFPSDISIVNDELSKIIANDLGTKSNEEIFNEIEDLFNNHFPFYTAYQKSSVINEFIKKNTELDIPSAFNDAIAVYNNIDFYIKTTAFEAIRDEFEAGRDQDEMAW
ncbi:TPA: hypothetical protein ACGZQ6_004219 [Escherichia coli]|uniref:hypothetical protein n=1 Tax=Escherichia coli TaxID=562 RepID=UPI000E1DD374|nr:hypothetical protein [Escherichia coli]RDQ03933.1 hypothetical protein C4A39_02617 [Escherichia coli]RDQ54381.1 hypothetical protein C4A28_02669 [Escherichia coli]